MAIRKQDIVDADFVDASELSSDGTLVYQSTISVVSTTASTKRIIITGADLIYSDLPAETGDKIVLIGNAAAGSYTIANIIDDTTLTVVESILDSTGGTASFIYPAGATKVGFSPTGQFITSATNLQDAIKDIAISSGTGISAPTHAALRQLIHFISEGPAEGFASGAYKETLPSANPFPTSIIWWESAAKTQKIVEKTLSYNSNKTINQIEWKMYDTDGTTLLSTVTDSITYSSIFEVNRTRNIT